MIEIQNLVKYYGKFQALKDVTFTVNNGEVVGFVGLNGAGKTTTIKISAGVLNPTSGDVLIDGHSITKEKKVAAKNIGWVPELPEFEDVKALDYFVYLTGYYGIPSSEAKKIGKELFQQLGIGGWENTKLSKFSQGMKKRFALAVSLAANPTNFLFDEVLNGLDPAGIQLFKDLTLKLKKEGKAVLFSSHILSEVENIADRVVFIHKGRIVDIKTMDELRNMVNTNVVRVRVENLNDRAVEIAKQFGNVSVVNGEIIISNFNSDLATLSNALKEFKVIDIGYERKTLEALFFEIISKAEGKSS